MERLERQGWSFLFDKAATEEYYRTHPDTCMCAPCRNFRGNCSKIPEELKCFLENFGIAVQNPIEQWSVDAIQEEQRAEHVIYYCVKGTAQSQEGYEIDIGSMQICILKQEDAGVPNHEMEDPCFVLVIYNLWLDWTLQDNIYEIYPLRKNAEKHKLLRRFGEWLIRKKGSRMGLHPF